MNFKGMREAVSLSQNDVANHMGYSTPQFISNWDRGISTPPLSSIDKLAKLYKVTPRSLAENIKAKEIEKIEKKYRKFIPDGN